MNAKPFTASRLDGRSDRQVVFELMRDAEPGTLFTFAAIEDALQAGIADSIGRPRACAAVRLAKKTLQQQVNRSVKAVRGRGYRLLMASEHVGVAVTHESRAIKQMKAGLAILQHCRLDEMSESDRTRHQGYTLTMVGTMNALTHQNARLTRIEKVLKLRPIDEGPVKVVEG